MSSSSAATTVDQYIESFPAPVQDRLRTVREILRAAAPDAVETISYAIPTFKLNGKNLVHFAGYTHHIGLYPGAETIAAFKDELSDYKTSKGAVQFPNDKELPRDLVQRMTEYRLGVH